MTTRRALSVLVATLTLATATPALAQLGNRPAEDWITRLERPDRVAGLKTEEVIQKLEIKKGMIVADLGAGPGVFALPFARATAPAIVYAVDIQPGFITHIEKRAAEQQLTNVRAVLGKVDDPLLPEKVDLAFFHDVVHHIADRAGYLKKVAGYLKPGGRIAVIELDATLPDASHRDEPDQQVTREQLDGWMKANGLEKTGEFAIYDTKWFVVYSQTNRAR